MNFAVLYEYMSVKNDVFVNILFHHLCQYGGWVCCSNERVKYVAVQHLWAFFL